MLPIFKYMRSDPIRLLSELELNAKLSGDLLATPSIGQAAAPAWCAAGDATNLPY